MRAPVPPVAHKPISMIHTWGRHGCIAPLVGGLIGNGAWPSANLAIYVPIVVPELSTIFQIAWHNGAVNAAANVDVGLYDEAGNALVTLGNTPQSGANAIQVGNIADTLVKPGRYFVAMVCSTTATATFRRFNANPPLQFLRACGLQQQATSSPLPTVAATFANPGFPYLPWIAVTTAVLK